MDWITPMEPISSSSIQVEKSGYSKLSGTRSGDLPTIKGDRAKIMFAYSQNQDVKEPNIIRNLHHIGNLVAGNNAVLDGEMVVPDNDGKPSFHLSLIREKTGRKDKLPHYIRKYR